MDKGTSRPYDDLNTIEPTGENEDAEMDEGEKGEEGDSNQNEPTPTPAMPFPGRTVRGGHRMNMNVPNLFGPMGDLPPPSPFNRPQASANTRLLKDETAKQFDFRHNKIPEGVTVIGEGQLEEQQDKSTGLLLAPKACLNLDRMSRPLLFPVFSFPLPHLLLSSSLFSNFLFL